jgi:FkbM family methyltransferase
MIKHAARQKLARRLGVPEIPSALERLRVNQFNPRRIFDVGAYLGEFTSLCRSIWPSAELICFEVLPHCVDQLRNWCDRDGHAAIVECLLGAECKHAVAFREMETASSVLEEHVLQVTPTNCYPMETIDEVVGKGRQGAPDLLKLDVQGYELEVLKGAEGTLPHVSAILTEVNLIDIHRGAPLLDELVTFMRDRGFVTYDICGLTRRPLDQALWQADFIFVPRESHIRADKRWQT